MRLLGLGRIGSSEGEWLSSTCEPLFMVRFERLRLNGYACNFMWDGSCNFDSCPSRFAISADVFDGYGSSREGFAGKL
jgi:hypothetical protein